MIGEMTAKAESKAEPSTPPGHLAVILDWFLLRAAGQVPERRVVAGAADEPHWTPGEQIDDAELRLILARRWDSVLLAGNDGIAPSPRSLELCRRREPEMTWEYISLSWVTPPRPSP